MPIAINARVDTAEVNRLLAQIERAGRQVQDVAERVVKDYLELIAREAKGYAPVDEGDLRSTIRVELERLAGAVIAGGIPGAETGKMVDYADVVELGRRDNPNYKPQPYLRPAFEQHAPGFARALQAALRGVTR